MIDNSPNVREFNLDGEWDAGIDRHYDRKLQVPGLATDPAKPTPGTLWYRKEIDIPAGTWTAATLTLKGARFAPVVYVDGQEVSSAEGGMAATVHRFPLGNTGSARKITLEIALKSLKDLNPKDASATPGPDLWRSNTSSYLWDSVILRLHGDSEVDRLVPWPDSKSNVVAIHWYLKGNQSTENQIQIKVLGSDGDVLAESKSETVNGLAGVSTISLGTQIKKWSPDTPNVYRLRAEIVRDGKLIDAKEQSFGVRDFVVKGLGFELNGEPFHLRMGTVVWHRWSRDAEAKLIAFDPAWFEKNIVLRLKELGANSLRFHLGLPPESFLDLCDRDGLAVQMEWPFFHGISASRESMSVQWQAWLDTAMRHPSVVLIHPWNETGGDVLHTAWSALDPLLKQYPPIVVSHRDVTPIHKYWWSLFENLGLYYDSATQFQQPVVADEFGGNYLDRDGNPGFYPETKGAFLRFLGRGNTKEERLELNADSNARVAEYWRRLGIAGFSPFCILGSEEDGSHWFMGPLNVPHPEPKPVWAALSAAFASQSLSLELWNRNFAPGETIRTPLWFFNDTDHDAVLTARLTVHAEPGDPIGEPILLHTSLKAHASSSQPIEIPLPSTPGEWRVSAELVNLNPRPTTPIISSWHVRTFSPQVAESLKSLAIGVPTDEAELREMLKTAHLKVVEPDDAAAKIIVGSKSTWARLCNDATAMRQLENAWRRGASVVLLDAGPQPLGAGYASGGQLGGPLEGGPVVKNPATLQDVQFFGGIHISFLETAEPESCVQQPESNKILWTDIPRPAMWLWNGLRGGLIVPACDMQVTGLSGQALLSVWQQRGADRASIEKGNCYAYELAGNYAYSDKPDDSAVARKLKQRVKFLVEDAPALQNVVNPDAPITVTDIGSLYRGVGTNGEAQALVPLASAGKNLSRTPAIELRFSPGTGSLIVSQLLTHGRLLPSESEKGPGVYGLRYDPVAAQVVLNLLAETQHD